MIRQIINWLKEVWLEMKRVNWPTRTNVLNHTAIVIAAVLVAMLIIASIDYGLSFLVRNFLIE